MLRAIKHGFANLTNFEGRDARQAFWYWVLFLYIVTIVLSFAVSVPMTVATVTTGIQQGMAQAGNADPAAAEAATQAAVMASMSDYLPMLVWVSLGSALILLVGLVASLARRLHDSDLSGWWAALPAGFQALSAAMIPSQMEHVQSAMTASMSGDPFASIRAMQESLGAGAIAGWTAILIVVVIGVRKSSDGANRYGEAPFIA